MSISEMWSALSDAGYIHTDITKLVGQTARSSANTEHSGSVSQPVGVRGRWKRTSSQLRAVQKLMNKFDKNNDKRLNKKEFEVPLHGSDPPSLLDPRATALCACRSLLAPSTMAL